MSRQVWNRAIVRAKGEVLRNIRYNPISEIYLRNVPLKSGLNVLEPGCGTGLDTLIVAKNFFITPFLLDFSKEALNVVKYAMNMLKVKAYLILADCRHLPFRDESFDCVWNNGVNEHFSGNDRQLVFDEMARVCKIRGYVLIAVPNSLNPFYRILKKILDLRGQWPFGFEQPFSHEELSKRMRKAGIKILSKDGYGFLDSIFAMLSYKNKFSTLPTNQLRKGRAVFSLISLCRAINYKKAFYNIYFGFVIIGFGTKIR